ncbi:MAG TPA: peptidylprolyl isomerase [Gemmataceae bacterium]|jgi:hypothetical protein|nr:peptidylprolyl isomerase [Gemmataceae bacterium]
MRVQLSRSRWLLGLTFLGLATLAIVWGRGRSIAQATAQPPAQSYNVNPNDAGMPAGNSDYSKRVVAYIFDTIPITREDLGEYFIKRLGAERVQNMVNRQIIETVCKQKGIEVTAAEIEADLAQTLEGLKTTSPDFVSKVLKPYNKNLIEWKEDVIRPRLLMAKLCRDRVQVTEEDMQMAFEAHYGESVDCKIILWPKNSERIAMSMYAKIRDSEEEFERAARTQASTGLGSTGGHLAPIFHHTAGNDNLERAAFSLRPGEMSELIQTPEGYVVVKCLAKLPPKNDKSLGDPKVREELTKEVFDKKLQLEIPKVFAELRAQANPKIFIGQQTTEEQLKRDVEAELRSGSGKAGPAARQPLRGN